MKLSERDRNLCAVLAVARWMTMLQLARLFFPQRNERDMRRRLRQLAGGEGEPALLVRHKWPTTDGLRYVWGLTRAGYGEAAQLVDEQLVMPPKEFDAGTMAHHEMLTELYVGLLAAPLEAALARIPKDLPPGAKQKALAGLFARAQHRGWRWTVVGDGVHLPWRLPEAKQFKKQVMRPDAVLELPDARRRIFVECETGTHTIVPMHGDNKPNSTLSKLERWSGYIEDLASYQPRQTHYEQKYRDGYAPEVLFLSHSERRAKNVTAAIENWRKTGHERRALVVRVWTLTTALGELLPVSGTLKEEPARVLPATLANAVDGIEAPALVRFIDGVSKDLDERLRSASITNSAKPFVPEGWEMAKRVATRLKRGAPPEAAKGRRAPNTGELVLMNGVLRATADRFHDVRVDARARNAPVPEYPPGLSEVNALLKKLAGGK